MEVIIQADVEAAASLVARLIARDLRQKPRLVLGLATGRTMERVYERLVGFHREDGLDFSRCRTFNLDEYIGTTEKGIQKFSGANRTKAILNLNPASPCIDMQTTVFAKVSNPDIAALKSVLMPIIEKIRGYVPGYHLIVEPQVENGRIVVMVRVRGLGDYLPEYAGNLDIINCAALAMAE